MGLRLRAGLLRRDPALGRRAERVAARPLAGRARSEHAALERACDGERDADDDEDDAERESQHVLRQPSGRASPEPPARNRAGEPGREHVPVDPVPRRRTSRSAATPRRKPTTRFVPAARRTSSPTERTSAGMRSVPRITPTAPPRTPITKASAPPRPTRRRSRGRGDDGAERKVDPTPDEDRRDEPVEEALRTRRRRAALPRSLRRPTAAPSRRRHASRPGPREHAGARRLRRLRPRWRCSSRQPTSGLPVTRTMSGRRSVPSTRPSIDPR